MNTEAIVSVEKYKMRFGDKTVIEDLSFDVNRGETFAFLGSNGSGKTTTIRTLLGIYEPTAGRLLINNQKYKPEMGKMLGYLPEERGLYKKETVLDTMIFFGKLKGVNTQESRKWSLDYLDRVGLADKAKTPVEKLSGGQQQKIQLGVTIINNPGLLILDEPTKGLDPVNRRLLMDIIEEHSSRGATVVMVTHQMEEVERICDRVILLKDGKRRLYGTVDEIRNTNGTPVIGLEFDGNLPTDPKTFVVNITANHSAEITPNPKYSNQQILHELNSAKDLNIIKFANKRASLDDIFVSIYNEDKKVGQL